MVLKPRRIPFFFGLGVTLTIYCGLTGCQFSLSDSPDRPDQAVGEQAGSESSSSQDLGSGGELILIAGEEESGALGGDSVNAGAFSGAGESSGESGGDQGPTEEELLIAALSPSERACEGAWMCGYGEGCKEGQCGECAQNDDCSRGDVCRDEAEGECGACDQLHPCSPNEECVEGICLATGIKVVSLKMTFENWRALLDSRYVRGVTFPCMLQSGEIEAPATSPVIDASSERPCRVRVHGGSSRDLRKLSLRLELNEPSESLAWGDDQMVLRAEYNDPTMMRNVLSHQAFARFTTLPHSRWRYLWLLVNDEPQGLYLQIERHRGSMIARWGRDPIAPRYESDPPTMLSTLGAGSLVTLDDRPSYWQTYELKGGVSYAPLIELIEDVIGMDSTATWLEDGGVARLASRFDWGQYLRYLALMTRLQNHDHIRKNFVITRQITDDQIERWEVHPWDLDLSWGCLYNDETGLTLCDQLIADQPLNFGQLPLDGVPSYPTDGVYNLLASRAVAPEAAANFYRQRLCELSVPLESDPNLTRLDLWRRALATKLAPWIEADPQRNEQISGTYQEHIEDLARFWEERGALINQEYRCAELE